MVTFFENRHIPLAINHCVSLYPTEDSELELNQIDFLATDIPSVTIGFSTHEYHDWTSSIMIAYAKGARTFERHIDIDTPDHPDLAVLLDARADRRVVPGVPQGARRCAAASSAERRRLPRQGDRRISTASCAASTPSGTFRPATSSRTRTIYLAIPLQKGQLSCRELITGDVLVAPLGRTSRSRLRRSTTRTRDLGSCIR